MSYTWTDRDGVGHTGDHMNWMRTSLLTLIMGSFQSPRGKELVDGWIWACTYILYSFQFIEWSLPLSFFPSSLPLFFLSLFLLSFLSSSLLSSPPSLPPSLPLSLTSSLSLPPFFLSPHGMQDLSSPTRNEPVPPAVGFTIFNPCFCLYMTSRGKLPPGCFYR